MPADNVLFLDEINGTPAILFWSDGHLNGVQTLDIRDNVIVGLHTLVNPDKLAFLQRQLESRPEPFPRSEEHTSELQSHSDLVCRLLLEKKKSMKNMYDPLPLDRDEARIAATRATLCDV